MFLGLLDQLLIFSQLDLIELLGLLTGLWPTELWHLIYPRLLIGLLHKLQSYGISGQIFGLFSCFLSNRQLRVVLDGKSLQEYPINAGVTQGSILGPRFRLTGLITNVVLMGKWMGLLLRKNHLLR